MHFIEQWFGISPDAGSGATELLYALGLAAAVVLFLAGRYLAPRRGAR